MREFEWCKKCSILYRAVNVTSQKATAAPYFTLLKQESRFTFGLNTAKNTPCIRNASNKSSQAWSKRVSKIAKFKIYHVLEWESTFTFGLNEFWIIFIWSTFFYTCFFFLQRSSKNWLQFPIVVQYNISKLAIFEAYSNAFHCWGR